MEGNDMKTAKHSLSTKETELVKLLIANCENTGDVQAMLKRLFAGTIEQMLEAEMEERIIGYAAFFTASLKHNAINPSLRV